MSEPPELPELPEKPPDHLLEAVGHLNGALDLIDRLGEFFQVEHAWIKTKRPLGMPPVLTDEEWVEAVNEKLDHLGFVMPEMYESLIYLAHSVQSLILEIGPGGAPPAPPEV